MKRTVHFEGIAKLDLAGVAKVTDYTGEIKNFKVAIAIQEELETLDEIEHGGTPTLTITLDIPLKGKVVREPSYD